MIEINTVEDLQNEWRDPYRQWYAAGMPAFVTGDKELHMQIKILFKTKEDRADFGDKLGYKLTDKTNFVFYPQKPLDINSNNRYVEDV